MSRVVRDPRPAFDAMVDAAGLKAFIVLVDKRTDQPVFVCTTIGEAFEITKKVYAERHRSEEGADVL